MANPVMSLLGKSKQSVIPLKPPAMLSKPIKYSNPLAPSKLVQETAQDTQLNNMVNQLLGSEVSMNRNYGNGKGIQPPQGTSEATVKQPGSKNGGSRSWRNNNPGNLVYGPFAKKMGAIGSDGRFAIFPDVNTGRKAMSSLLSGPSYKNLSISDAIARYAPSFENNVPAYVKAAGLNPSLRIADLSQGQFNTLLDNMIKHEGWIPG